jgi:hypothetical protein
MKKKLKEYQKGALALTTTGITLGAGASMVGAMPNAPAGANQALSRYAGFIPVAGNVMGGGITLGLLQDLNNQNKKKRGKTWSK